MICDINVIRSYILNVWKTSSKWLCEFYSPDWLLDYERREFLKKKARSGSNKRKVK